MTKPTARDHPRTSHLVQHLLDGWDEPTISMANILRRLRQHALSFIVLIFALPCCLPMPPGLPTISGVVYMIVAGHLIFGRQTLMLPRSLAERTVSRERLQGMLDRAAPYIARLERFTRPRLLFVTGRLGEVLIGITLFVLGLILIVPIPFLGNLPPGLAGAVLALGMFERDGVITLLGFVLSAGAVVFTSTLAWATLKGILALLT